MTANKLDKYLFVLTVSKALEEKYGRSFTVRNVKRMIQFSERFPDLEIVSPLATQLSWSHFVELLPIKNGNARLFYAQKTAEEKLHHLLKETKARIQRNNLLK